MPIRASVRRTAKMLDLIIFPSEISCVLLHLSPCRLRYEEIIRTSRFARLFFISEANTSKQFPYGAKPFLGKTGVHNTPTKRSLTLLSAGIAVVPHRTLYSRCSRICQEYELIVALTLHYFSIQIALIHYAFITSHPSFVLLSSSDCFICHVK